MQEHPRRVHAAKANCLLLEDCENLVELEFLSKPPILSNIEILLLSVRFVSAVPLLGHVFDEVFEEADGGRRRRGRGGGG